MTTLEKLNKEMSEFRALKPKKKKRNTWTLNDIIIYDGDGFVEVVLRDNKQNITEITKIDIKDVDLIKKYKWHLHKTGYPSTKHKNTTTTMHRILLNFPNGIIDHKNRNKMDNRKYNLKVGSQGDNNKNKTPIYKRKGSIFCVKQNVKKKVKKIVKKGVIKNE